MANNEEPAQSGASGQPVPGSVITPGAAPPEKPAKNPQPAPPPAVDEAILSDNGQSVSWTASEFVAHSKTTGWYLSLIVAAAVLAVGVYLLTRDVVSTGVVVLAGLILAVYGSHQPRQLNYVISPKGIGVGDKYYAYEEFRSFSVAPEGAFSSLVFMPLKRFAVPLTIYYAPANEEKIVSIVSDYLPLEDHRPDAIDTLMKRIRF